MDPLSTLFGGQAKIKVMRIFLFNPNSPFDAKDVAIKIQIRLNIARREIRILEKAKLIKRRSFKNAARKRVSGWILNEDFPYLTSFQSLLINVQALQHDRILRKLSKIGRLKEVALAGVFIQDWDSRADILVVADKIKKRVLENVMKNVEAEVGKEIKYIALETTEFQYRLNMGDKLIRDILDYPHEVALDKLGILARN